MRHGAPFQALPSICSPPCWHSNHISSPYHSSLQTRFLSSLEEGQRNSISSCVEACASNTLRVRIWLGYRHKREVWISTFTAHVHRFYCYPVLICNLTKPITSVLLLYASVCVCMWEWMTLAASQNLESFWPFWCIIGLLIKIYCLAQKLTRFWNVADFVQSPREIKLGRHRSNQWCSMFDGYKRVMMPSGHSLLSEDLCTVFLDIQDRPRLHSTGFITRHFLYNECNGHILCSCIIRGLHRPVEAIYSIF